jgi:phosphoenolpyruvate carboxykinase (GTP)
MDWRGRDWTPSSPEPAAHPNSRFCTPLAQCPILAAEWDSPEGVPVDALLFGGRRRDTMPLVTEARDWQHGVFLAATLSSETTAAASGQTGVVRRDPMAMLPFIGYNVGDYLKHWIELGKNAEADKLPKIFYVNWFRKDADGSFLWPGFRENMRVLKWVVARIEDKAPARDTAIGYVPSTEALDTDSLGLLQTTIERALTVDVDEWRDEIARIETWFSQIGAELPSSLQDEFETLRSRLTPVGLGRGTAAIDN